MTMNTDFSHKFNAKRKLSQLECDTVAINTCCSQFDLLPRKYNGSIQKQTFVANKDNTNEYIPNAIRMIENSRRISNNSIN